jgi:hypothetical protein
VLAVGACAAALVAFGCGASERSGKAAVINEALRQLQTEIEGQRSKLDTELRKKLGSKPDILGKIELVYAAPPKGVSAAEWRTAVQKDRALQRVIHSAST